MGSCVSRFVKNETDFNSNGKGDRDELIREVIKHIDKILEEKNKVERNNET
tara:strand:+ start:1707 stop:1859 length:153 start_codon:yes stop_codon:yes gene_type:complete